MELSIIVPCFNEQEGLENLAANIKDLEGMFHGMYELILVDDGSRESMVDALRATFPESSRRTVKVLRHDRNRGIGAAVRIGIENASGSYIATIDSDCTYKPFHLAEMLEILKREGGDLITASPYHPKGQVVGVPGNRLFLSKGLSAIYSVILGAKIYTYTGIFRIYRANAVKSIRFDSDGFLSQAEMLIRAFKKGYKVIEYPATLTKRTYGVSNAKVARVIGEHLGFIRKLVLGKVIG